ncbi:hypothetical protein AMTR_s00129p00059410 [Amborella trichopoda]|uniref:Uncharacterized protein n=1 Tax=Amborella trichopoda TaxID=13333 RepID=W1NLB7_AMBTC|nr:hypothetical protein AMTR_s00129p00059410 [Amborella trichopoda]
MCSYKRGGSRKTSLYHTQLVYSTWDHEQDCMVHIAPTSKERQERHLHKSCTANGMMSKIERCTTSEEGQERHHCTIHDSCIAHRIMSKVAECTRRVLLQARRVKKDITVPYTTLTWYHEQECTPSTHCSYWQGGSIYRHNRLPPTVYDTCIVACRKDVSHALESIYVPFILEHFFISCPPERECVLDHLFREL